MLLHRECGILKQSKVQEQRRDDASVFGALPGFLRYKELIGLEKTVRNKKLVWNTLSALLYQGVAVICGFVLPRAILSRYGSDVNGLVNSITQFLQLITFLELGVGAVVQSALYKPLADRNSSAVSAVIASGNNFFRKLAGILAIYVVVLVFLYPVLVNNTYGFAYNAALILSMSISFFAQYYFGIVDGLLLKADQKGYIVYVIDMVTVVMNTGICYGLIHSGVSIQTVKLMTSGIYLLRPILVRVYIRKNYQIDRKCKYSDDPVKQKWNGVAQHVAAIVLDGTDVVVLSIFSTMSDVSIYSVYHLVATAIRNLFMNCVGGVRSLFGELWSKGEREELNRYFAFTEWFLHAAVLFIWCCTYRLIVPFVLVYTKHMTDANYNVPVFAALICTAYMLFCLRLPYHNMIQAAGHYASTQNIYIVSASLNLILSVLAVNRWGLVGVTVGTIVAMLYQMLHMAYYVIKKLEIHSFMQFAKQYAVDGMTVIFALLATKGIPGLCTSWMGWIVLAIKNAAMIAVCLLATNVVFYNKEFMRAVHKVMKKC